MSGSLRSFFVAVGDELLLGDTVDTNGAWLSGRLREWGAPVYRRSVVGDDPAEIRAAVVDALEAADLVVVSGGLGPTPDDRTREVVSELLEIPLTVDAELLDRLRSYVERRGYPFPENNVSQARVPVRGRWLENPIGTAPGLVFEPGDGRAVVLLPGVPRELRTIADGALADYLSEFVGERGLRIHTRVIHTTGRAEASLSDDLVLPEDGGPVELAFLPDETGVDLRLTARGVGEDEAERWFDRWEAAMAPALERWRFESDSGDLVVALARELRRRGWTLATAESCTGGLAAKRLTDEAGASEWFLGGVVSYADESKVRDLEVPGETIERSGAVSEEVARAMAEGVARRFGTDCGIGVTGVAGPSGGTEEKPVGTVWIAARTPDGTVARKDWWGGDRVGIRARSAQAALALLFRAIQSPPDDPNGSAPDG